MKRKVKQIAAGALASVMAGSMMVFLFSAENTAAATSLPHIESIVSGMKGGSGFHILEIVPEGGAGSIGYYISGQEPSACWKETAGSIKSGMPDSDGIYGNAAGLRTSEMAALLNRLSNAHLLSSGGTTPLTSTGNYQETLPWERSGSGYGSLTLDHKEKVTVTGVFSQKEEGATTSVGYDYTQQSTYEILENGQYVQRIAKFIPSTEVVDGEDTYFYYAPTFAPLTETDAEKMADKDIAVYTNASTDKNSMAAPVYGQYQYYGQLGNGLEHGRVYYYATETGAPAVAADASHVYKARLDTTDPYINVGRNGYFNLTVTGYSYAGDGIGVYKFEKTQASVPGAVTLPIIYSTVYYKGGYTNNNWFLTKVLDVDASEVSGIKINVTSVTPKDLTETDISDYQLIVLSGGYVPNGTPGQQYSVGNNDVSVSVKNAILTAVAGKVPVLVDNALTAAGLRTTNIGSLAQAIKNGNANTAFVDENVYFIDTSVKNLATKDFDAAFGQSLYKTAGTPFYDVFYEIYHENFLRKTENPETTDLLDESVSIAKSIRYIINFGQQRQISTKAKITVLDIEPSYYIPNSTSTQMKLTPQRVLEWLPSNAYLQDDITIVTMTTAEFIGKIEDVSETYDMVYFGPSTYKASDYSYNDSDMDGLVYTNTGDTYKAKNMSGLLNRDYLNTSYGTFTLNGAQYPYLDATSNTAADRFRFSGNDLTTAKVQKLKDFAATGYPVILSDYLLKSDGTVNSAVVDSASQVYNLFDTIKSRSNVMRATSAASNKEAIYEYLNLSKPEIVFAQGGFPTKYDESQPDRGSLTPIDGVYALTYRFQIINATDATPQETTYQAALYLDQDGNGNYVPSENLADILCYLDEGEKRISVEPTELKAGTSSANAPTYIITRQLSAEMSGILPWKLEITKNGEDNEYIHTSEINYAYIRPETPKVLNILQIDTTADAGGYNLENATTYTGSGSYDGYKGIYGKLLHKVESDFKVNIYTIYTDDLDNLNNRDVAAWYNYFAARKNGNTKIDNYTTKVLDYLSGKAFFTKSFTNKSQALSGLLQQFDMLIVGFGDCYADFNADSAPAVVDYIDSGKAILFSHDTTSFYNVPSGYQQMTVKPETDQIDLSAENWKKTTPSYGSIALSNQNENQVTAKYTSTSYGSGRNRYYRATGAIYQDVTLSPGTYTLSATAVSAGRQGTQTLTCASRSANFQGGAASVSFTVSSKGTYRIRADYDGAAQASSYTATVNYAFALMQTVDKQVGSAPTGWGYYFNTILRSKVSLDRYGIVADDTVTGDSGSAVRIRDILKAAVDGSISSDIASKIEAAGYTVAYDAKGTSKNTVAETQGITNYELLRYGTDTSLKGVNGLGSSNGNTFGTNKVSQVNQGQITTYPYNLNTTTFDAQNTIGDMLTVTDTHEQYYQLNMNSDDIVVWYCLAGGSYQNAPNDVVNSYYIYTVGNVTYTGAGHTSAADSINKAEGEAKLFINTMIAAYRPERTEPSISVVDSPGSTSEISNYYLTVDYDGSGYSNSLVEQSNACPVFFIVSDANLDVERITDINLSYRTSDGKKIQYTSELPVYRAPAAGRTYTANINGTSGMVSGMTYYFNLPQTILDAFSAEQNTSTMNIEIQVSTRFKDNKTLSGSTDLALLKVGLLGLG